MNPAHSHTQIVWMVVSKDGETFLNLDEVGRGVPGTALQAFRSGLFWTQRSGIVSWMEAALDHKALLEYEPRPISICLSLVDRTAMDPETQEGE